MNELRKPRTNRAGNFDFQGQNHGTAATRKGHETDLYENSWRQRGERKADRNNKKYDVTSGLDEHNNYEDVENKGDYQDDGTLVEASVSQNDEYSTQGNVSNEWNDVDEHDYLDALYQEVSRLLTERNSLPRTADNHSLTQTQLDSQKDELDAEIDSLKYKIEDIEGLPVLPTDESVGLWTKKMKEDYLRKKHSMHGDDEGDDLGLDIINDSMRSHNISVRQ